MISILTGAKKNIGDYLIGSRAKALLEKYVDEDIYEIDRFQDIRPHLKKINQSRALILCGGPAYTKDIYPNIYKLNNIIKEIKVPIIPFGLGWSGSPFHNPLAFEFTEEASNFIKDIHQTIKFSSCRDVLTESILKDKGVENVVMTGCPVWYHMPDLEKNFTSLKNVDHIIFSTGAKQVLWKQSIQLLREIKKEFPEAKITVSYHRGIFPGKQTPLRKGLSYTLIAIYAKVLGLEAKDVSSDLQKIAFYENCDLHIGYRVHAHLDFLSRRKPSYLINEDGRGLGMVKSLELPIFNYDDKNVVHKVLEQVNEDKSSNFESFRSTFEKMKNAFTSMKTFLDYLKTL